MVTTGGTMGLRSLSKRWNVASLSWGGKDVRPGSSRAATMKLSERYDPKSVEPTWQERWEKAGLFRADARPDAPKKYVLEMLPYPSGSMPVSYTHLRAH